MVFRKPGCRFYSKLQDAVSELDIGEDIEYITQQLRNQNLFLFNTDDLYEMRKMLYSKFIHTGHRTAALGLWHKPVCMSHDNRLIIEDLLVVITYTGKYNFLHYAEHTNITNVYARARNMLSDEINENKYKNIDGQNNIVWKSLDDEKIEYPGIDERYHIWHFAYPPQ